MTTRLADGDAAPAFSLPDADGQEVSLADFAGQRVIVYFYPAAMTPGCTTQAVDFTAAMADLTAAGLHVIGVSPDTQEKLIQFRDQQSVSFPLLSDVDKTVLSAYGAYGEKLLYGKLIEGVIRSTFVDRRGRRRPRHRGGRPVQRQGDRARRQAEARPEGLTRVRCVGWGGPSCHAGSNARERPSDPAVRPAGGYAGAGSAPRSGQTVPRGTRTLTPEGTGT